MAGFLKKSFNFMKDLLVTFAERKLQIYAVFDKIPVGY